MSLTVNLYTLPDCPYCPVMEEALRSLQRERGFRLRTVDLRWHPEVARRKGLRAVPSVDIGRHRVIGPADTAELAGIIDRCLKRPVRG